jgi:hypothetical protein
LKCGFQKKVCTSKSPTFFSRKPLVAMWPGLFNLLASFKKQTEINTLYNIVNSSGKLSGNNLAWVNYYYNFVKANYQTALNNLQGISYSNENENNLIQLL